MRIKAVMLTRFKGSAKGLLFTLKFKDKRFVFAVQTTFGALMRS